MRQEKTRKKLISQGIHWAIQRALVLALGLGLALSFELADPIETQAQSASFDQTKKPSRLKKRSAKLSDGKSKSSVSKKKRKARKKRRRKSRLSRRQNPKSTLVAYNQDEKRNSSGASKAGKAEPKPWGLGLTAEHHFPSVEDGEHFNVFYFSGYYTFTPWYRLRIIQPAVKRYEIDEVGGEDFALQDTAFWNYFTLSKTLLDASWTLRPSFTLPVSTKSRDTDLISRGTLWLIVTKNLFNDRWSISLRPYYRHFWYDFSTTRDGDLLPKNEIGHLLMTRVGIVGEFGFNFWMQNAMQFQQDPADQVSTRSTSQEDAQPNDASLAIDLFFDYNFNDYIAARAGYSHSDRLIKDGRYVVDLFEAGQSTWMLGLDFTL